jgi:hypothetical protein
MTQEGGDKVVVYERGNALDVDMVIDKWENVWLINQGRSYRD